MVIKRALFRLGIKELERWVDFWGKQLREFGYIDDDSGQELESLDKYIKKGKKEDE